jgi:hypothetical protein
VSTHLHHRIANNPFVFSSRKVRDGQNISPFNGTSQVEQGFFTFTSQHSIDEGIFLNEFSVENGGGHASENNEGLGMIFLADFCDFNGAVGVDRPVEIDPENAGIGALYVGFDIEAFVIQHSFSEVHNRDVIPHSLDVLAHADESNWEH